MSSSHSTTSFMSRISLVGRNNHSCGYCHSSDDTSYTYGMWAHSLACEDYQTLIDRGWRRSGQYLYKPDLRKSCCPQYTIRLNANEFSPTKSQRKIINKFNRFIEGSWKPLKEEEMDGKDKSHQTSTTATSKVNYDTRKNLMENIQLIEKDYEPADHAFAHKFEIVLEPSSVTKEKFELYRKYQVHIHHDKPGEVSEHGFKRFLVDSPLKIERFAEGNGQGYGSFHQKYILDGKLVAIAVLDILPKCVSSVYFIYDPDYNFLGLGNYSALREISLTQTLEQSVSNKLHWYYMGYYIHSCPKMSYKGGYQPSELLDAETYRWYPINECKKQLDKKKFTVFSDPEKDWNNDKDNDEEDRIPGTLKKDQIKPLDVHNTHILLQKKKLVPVTDLVAWYDSQEFRDIILEHIAIVGPDLNKHLVIEF